jgi:hypothetical protein
MGEAAPTGKEVAKLYEKRVQRKFLTGVFYGTQRPYPRQVIELARAWCTKIVVLTVVNRR